MTDYQSKHTGAEIDDGIDDAITALQPGDVVNNLTSTSTTAPLSAAQGKALEDGKLAPADIVNSLTSTSTTAPLGAGQGKILQDGKAAKTTTITAGTGLTGGGDLSANRTISISSATQTSLGLADSALQGSDVIDNLTSTDTDLPLSANQGKLLDEKIATLAEAILLDQVAQFTWDSGTSSPASSVTRSVPSYVTENLYDLMRGCVLNTDGTVNYYLKSDDWTLQADGVTASDLTGADGNVMIEIPKFYYRTVRVGTEITWQISTIEISGFTVHPAFILDGVEVSHRYISAYDAALKFSRSITAVADAGGGDITVTTSVQHPLYAGDPVTISGTTSYDGDYTVVSRPSGTTFTVTATYVATETGTAAGYVSGKNLDDMTGNIDTSTDELASAKGFYPLVGVTRDECRTLGENVGTAWRQLDFYLWSAVQMLYLVEYQTFYSQDVLGDGNTNGSYIASSSNQSDSPHTIAGAGDSWADGSTDGTQPSAGAKPGTAYMKYRGIENMYGNVWNWADAINVNVGATGNVHLANDNDRANYADDTSTNHTLVSSSLSTGSNYISALLPLDEYFLASAVSGSSSTYITDRHYGSASSNRVVLVGGGAADVATAGVFWVVALYDSSGAARVIGARLAR